MSFSDLPNERLTAVEFVQEGVQLRFGEAMLALFVWPDVADADGISVGFGQPTYRDALCSPIGELVTEADLDEDHSLTIEFETGTVFALSLRAEDLDTPEVGSFTSSDGEVTEF